MCREESWPLCVLVFAQQEAFCNSTTKKKVLSDRQQTDKQTNRGTEVFRSTCIILQSVIKRCYNFVFFRHWRIQCTHWRERSVQKSVRLSSARLLSFLHDVTDVVCSDALDSLQCLQLENLSLSWAHLTVSALCTLYWELDSLHFE